MTHVIRPITVDDIDAVEEIAMSATLGLTSLPKNRHKLEEKLIHAVKSFERENLPAEDELYLFALENRETNHVGGTTGIMSRTGVSEPAHFFRVETIQIDSDPRVPEQKILRPVTTINGPSEICSLFLKKEYRKGGLGKLLSFSRFLFMARERGRFDDTCIAEMRGVINQRSESPLWNAIGSHFFNCSFEEAMMLRDRGQFHLIDVLPEYPIYLSLLPQNAQHVIGKVHTNTKPALKMLRQQGFSETNDIDLFDGGPKIEAATDEIKVIRKSIVAPVSDVVDSLSDGYHAIICNETGSFKAVSSTISKRKKGLVTIPREVADALQVEKGSKIRYYKLEKL